MVPTPKYDFNLYSKRASDFDISTANLAPILQPSVFRLFLVMLIVKVPFSVYKTTNIPRMKRR